MNNPTPRRLCASLLRGACFLGLLLPVGCYSDLDDQNAEIIQARLAAFEVEVTPNPVVAGDSLTLRLTRNGTPRSGRWEIGGATLRGQTVHVQAPSSPGTHEFVVWVPIGTSIQAEHKKRFQVTVVR